MHDLKWLHGIVRETRFQIAFGFLSTYENGTIFMNYVSRYSWTGILLAFLIAPTAQAGGLYLYELGTPDVGAAAAGWAARASCLV